MPPASEGWNRLHPLSPLFQAGRAGLFGIYVVLEAPDILGVDLVSGSLLAGLLFALVAVAYGVVAWRVTGYRVGDDELELRTGVLFRSHRRVPLARIESVDVARPIIARLFGLADVRAEAVSQGSTEVHLKYLSDRDAWRVRESLSASARLARAGEPAPTGAEPVQGRDEAGDEAGDQRAEVGDRGLPETERPLLQTPTRELFVGYVGAAIAVTGTVTVVASVIVGIFEPAAGLGVVVFGLVTGAALVVAMLMRIERIYAFRVAEGPDGLVIHRGLLNLTTQRIAVGRIQAVRISEPVFWRPFGRVQVSADVAGYRGSRDTRDSATLLPIAPREVVAYLLAHIEQRVDLDSLRFDAAPRRAKLRAPVRSRTFAIAETPDHLVTRSGLLWRRTDIVPHAKVQSIRVTQGSWQRVLGLSTVHLDTAGSQIRARARHRGTADAVALAAASRQRVVWR